MNIKALFCKHDWELLMIHNHWERHLHCQKCNKFVIVYDHWR